MCKFFFPALCILLSCNVSCGQTSNIIVENPEPLDNHNQVSDSVYLELTKQDKYFEIKITNTLKDTIFLFDSYLINDLIDSKYLHRMDKENKICKISFIPIIPYLSVEKTDAIIIGKERIVRRNQVLYSFKAIPPKRRLCIKIIRDAFNKNDLVEDFNAKKFTKFDNPKFTTLTDVRCVNTFIEFAFYKDISLLSNIKSYYLDEFNFNNQAQAYKILSAPL
jgi:hypothetical protein